VTDSGSTLVALADLENLTHGQKSVTDLAAPFQMWLPAVTKHLEMLAKAGLKERDDGRPK
jgi:hypothetical protein